MLTRWNFSAHAVGGGGDLTKTFRQLVDAMTNAEVASALGISSGQASRIRTGTRAVTLPRLWTFVRHVGTDRIDVILTLAEESARYERAKDRRAERGNG